MLPIGGAAPIDRATELVEVPHRTEMVSGDEAVRAGSGLRWRSQKLHRATAPATREKCSQGDSWPGQAKCPFTDRDERHRYHRHGRPASTPSCAVPLTRASPILPGPRVLLVTPSLKFVNSHTILWVFFAVVRHRPTRRITFTTRDSP